VGHDDIAILQVIQRTLEQSLIGDRFAWQFIPGKPRWRPSDVRIAATLPRDQQARRQVAARRAPERVERRAGQFLETPLDAVEFLAILFRGPDQFLPGMCAELRFHFDAAVRQIALHVHMVEGMGAERMPLRNQ
jgi:hypothetical protein